jgi:hypothetical protein
MFSATKTRRPLFASLVALVIGASSFTPAMADTYLSFWDNQSKCGYTVTGNGSDKFIPSGTKHDFGPTPAKDPTDVRVTSEACSALKNGQIAYTGVFPHRTCGSGEPYRFQVRNDQQSSEFCYCITALHVGYIDVHVKNSGIELKHGKGTYACGD